MMRAMQLDRPGEPLRLVGWPIFTPGPGEVVIDVAACGVCRTDLHVVEGDLHGLHRSSRAMRSSAASCRWATASKVRAETTPLTLEEANRARDLLRAGRIEGAAVLVP